MTGPCIYQESTIHTPISLASITKNSDHAKLSLGGSFGLHEDDACAVCHRGLTYRFGSTAARCNKRVGFASMCSGGSRYTGKKIVFRTLGFNLSTLGSVPSNVFKVFEYV